MTTEQAVRDEVRGWLDANWDPERPIREWREILVDSGWACPTWPERVATARACRASSAPSSSEEFAKAGAVGPAIGVGHGRSPRRRSSTTARTS